MERIADKVAVVTGGGSGIGQAAVRRLAEEGATVVVVDLHADNAAAMAAEVGGTSVAGDVGDPAVWQQVVDHAISTHGGIDIAYLNAGVTTQQPDILALTDAQYRRVMGPNVDGVVFGTRAVAPAMIARGGGAIVATASLAGLISFPPDPIYTLTKHAVVGFVRSVAPQLEAKGVTVNAICPGIVDTPLVGEAREMLKQANFPMIDPAAIADAVVDRILGTATGECWAVQPGRPAERFVFGEAPGPRGAGQGMRPPSVAP